MSSRSIHLYLQDIQQACQDILTFTTDLATMDEFAADRRTMLAVTRCFEIIGEAARQIPEPFQSQNPAIPWRAVISFRNVMAHEYFGVDFEIVWDVIQNEIPALLENISLLIEHLPEE